MNPLGVHPLYLSPRYPASVHIKRSLILRLHNVQLRYNKTTFLTEITNFHTPSPLKRLPHRQSIHTDRPVSAEVSAKFYTRTELQHNTTPFLLSWLCRNVL